jgi:hypothetical protein
MQWMDATSIADQREKAFYAQLNKALVIEMNGHG